jgi:predicted nucleic acid-binding protein
MKNALIDASSAILLYKAKLLETMTEVYRLSMTPTVYKEITVQGRSGVIFFRRAINTGRINVLRHHPSNLPDTVVSRLDMGEAETIKAYRQQNAHFIIIDDKKGAQVCRTQKIPYINALLCPNLLYWSKKIDADTCRKAFAQIQRIGWYASHVVHFAQNTTATRMHHFLP